MRQPDPNGTSRSSWNKEVREQPEYYLRIDTGEVYEAVDSGFTNGKYHRWYVLLREVVTGEMGHEWGHDLNLDYERVTEMEVIAYVATAHES